MFHGLFAVVTYKKESPIDPYEILLFLVSMIMFRGVAFLIRSVFFCACFRPEYATLRTEAKGFPQLPLYFKPGELQIKFIPSFLKNYAKCKKNLKVLYFVSVYVLYYIVSSPIYIVKT